MLRGAPIGHDWNACVIIAGTPGDEPAGLSTWAVSPVDVVGTTGGVGVAGLGKMKRVTGEVNVEINTLSFESTTYQAAQEPIL